MTPLTGPDESGHDGQRNAGLTAAERQAILDHHPEVPAGDEYGSWCGGDHHKATPYPCETVRCVHALDATEKERDEAWLMVEGIVSRYGRRKADGSLSLTWYEVGPEIPQPDAATAATIAGFCGECGLSAGSDGCAHGDGAA